MRGRIKLDLSTVLTNGSARSANGLVRDLDPDTNRAYIRSYDNII